MAANASILHLREPRRKPLAMFDSSGSGNDREFLKEFQRLQQVSCVAELLELCSICKSKPVSEVLPISLPRDYEEERFKDEPAPNINGAGKTKGKSVSAAVKEYATSLLGDLFDIEPRQLRPNSWTCTPSQIRVETSSKICYNLEPQPGCVVRSHGSSTGFFILAHDFIHHRCHCPSVEKAAGDPAPITP